MYISMVKHFNFSIPDHMYPDWDNDSKFIHMYLNKSESIRNRLDPKVYLELLIGVKD